MVVVLPAKPNNGADTTCGQLGVLVSADNGAGRFLATTISPRSGGLERRRRGEPPTHRLGELSRVSRRSMALLGPIDGLFVDG